MTSATTSTDSQHPSDARVVAEPKPPGRIFASTGSRYYPIVVALFASLLLVSNISATKGVTFGPVWGFPINTDGGFLLFPLAYVLGDVLSEVYGFKATRTAIYLGFGIALGAILYFGVVLTLPAADFYTDQNAFRAVLWNSTSGVLIASLAGYIIGQTLNALTVVKMKAWTNGRHMWARLLGSTVVGEFADTLVFCLIAAPIIGFKTPADIIVYTLLGFVYKCAVEAAVLPITYRVIAALKKREPSYHA